MKRLLRREKLNDHEWFERDLEITRETGDRRGTDYINLVITYAALGPGAKRCLMGQRRGKCSSR